MLLPACISFNEKPSFEKSHESAINYQSPLASSAYDDEKRDFKWTVKCAAKVHLA